MYYEIDDDLSKHVLELSSYIPDGPENSWVLLERADGAMAEAAVVTEVEVEADIVEMEEVAPCGAAIEQTD